jgi:glycosyltransferase involved in cell wall biosynthesis
MKILIFLPSVERGGCEQAAVNLAQALHAMDNEVLVCHPEVSRTISLKRSFQSVGCRHVNWRCGEQISEDWPADSDQFSESLLVLRATAPDVVVAVLPEPTSAFGFLRGCFESKKRTFVIFQLCDEPFRTPRHFLDAVTAVQDDLFPTYISVSRESVGRLADGLGVDKSSIQVLPNFSGQHLLSHASKWSARADNQNSSMDLQQTVVTIGRITRQKGYEYLVDAASHVTRVMPSVRFVWVGDGEDEAIFRRLIEARGLDALFSLVGWCHRVDLHLLSADLFVLPSLWEGTPLSISEAMALGCPIVATDVGGVSEMLNRNEAWLVEPEDTESLQRSILCALANPRLASRKAARARARWLRDSEEGSRRLVRLIVSP